MLAVADLNDDAEVTTEAVGGKQAEPARRIHDKTRCGTGKYTEKILRVAVSIKVTEPSNEPPTLLRPDT